MIVKADRGEGGLLLVISDLASGGAQQVVSQVANLWAKQGRSIGVATLSDPSDDFFQLDQAVERFSFGTIANSRSVGEKLAGNIHRVFELRTILRDFGGETVVGFIAPTNILLILAAPGLGYRVIISERNDPARQSFGVVWGLLRRLLYRRANAVTANSRGAIETMRSYVPQRKLVYLPNPLRQPVRRKETDTLRDKSILNVGRLHHQKGQDLLIKAFALVLDRLPDWCLKIAGEGSERSALEMLAKDLSVSDRVEFLGRVADPFDLYRRASIFAFPSRWEGMPNALIEAMSCGLPCVVSDSTPGHMELVTHGHNGLVIKGESVADLAEALVKLGSDKRLRKKLGDAATERTHEFSPALVMRIWDNVIAR